MLTVLLLATFLADEPTAEPPTAADTVSDVSPLKVDATKLGRPLNEQKTVFLDTAGKRLWLKTVVARDTGILEMFLCKKGTKEHESVVAIDSPAFTIHAGLLALGLEPGSPAQFQPTFVPPQGPELDIVVHWTDADGKKRSRPAAEWMRRVTARWFTVKCDPELAATIDFPKELDFRYIKEDNELLWFGPLSKAMAGKLKALSTDDVWQTKIDQLRKATRNKPFKGSWVFAGSGFWIDEETNQRRYLAESGNLICVANFGDAMIDVDFRSPTDNDDLLFEPWTERIPQPGTAVLVEIRRVRTDEP